MYREVGNVHEYEGGIERERWGEGIIRDVESSSSLKKENEKEKEKKKYE